MITHNRTEIEAQGFTTTGIAQDTMPGYGRMRQVAMAFDITMASLTAFRLDDGLWEIFKRPKVVAGFKDEPLLP